MEMYLVLANGVFRSTDTGDTWHAFNNGLSEPEIQDAAAIGNCTLFGDEARTLPVQFRSMGKITYRAGTVYCSLAVAGNRIYFSAKTGKDQKSELFFASDDFGRVVD